MVLALGDDHDGNCNCTAINRGDNPPTLSLFSGRGVKGPPSTTLSVRAAEWSLL